MKGISDGTYDFAELRGRGCVYVDKTAYFHRLIDDPSRKFYFLSRPRRFGKSLMISALQNIFEGRRELFEGLAIARGGYDWKPHRVLRFDFSNVGTESLALFGEALRRKVGYVLQDAGLEHIPDDCSTAAAAFEYGLRELRRKHGPLVVLVDEYDAPIAHALARDVKLAEAIRESLAQFYIQLKAYESHIRFLMLTGVSKFNQASVFSALNNVTDLSMRPDCAAMLGYTEDELTANFGEHMRAHAGVMGLSHEAYRAELRRWYDGYRFSPESAERVYNPVAIAKTLKDRAAAFGPTWTATGSASLLLHLIGRGDLLRLNPAEPAFVPMSVLGAVADLSCLNAHSVLFQTGYLTIAEAEAGRPGVFLGIPNEEVRRDYEALYLNLAARKPDDAWQGTIYDALDSGRPEAAFPLLQDLYAGMVYGPGEPVHEAHYRRLLMLLFRLRERRAEEPNAAGTRSDLVIDLPRCTYLVEFKNTAADTADTALAQIKARGYAAPYLHGAKAVFALGLAFDPRTHLLKDAKAERLA